MSESLSAQQLARLRTKLEERLAAQPEGRKAEHISAALTRIKQGEYGYCIECGEEISAARLAMKPEIPLCVDCQTLKDEEDDES